MPVPACAALPSPVRSAFTDAGLSTALAAEAAACCQRCPLATGCLLDALRLDAAHRHGRDPWGISGICGGVWFRPGQSPRRIPTPCEGGDRL